jgi:hypothetical protein
VLDEFRSVFFSFKLYIITLFDSIEHLFPETLKKFELNVFGIYNPKLVIISTPNSEFNIHFPNLNYNTPESSFRHYDHKFEWTRKEFETWCNKQCLDYGYHIPVNNLIKAIVSSLAVLGIIKKIKHVDHVLNLLYFIL